MNLMIGQCLYNLHASMLNIRNVQVVFFIENLLFIIYYLCFVSIYVERSKGWNS